MEELLDYIKKLKESSFEGWDQEAVKGYLTALISIEEHIKKLRK